jgi:hypothetical protein
MANVSPASKIYLHLAINLVAHCTALFLAIEMYTVWIPHYIVLIRAGEVRIPEVTLWLQATSRFIVSYWVIVAFGIMLIDATVSWVLVRRCSAHYLWQWSILVLFAFMVIFAITGIVLCLPVPFGQP